MNVVIATGTRYATDAQWLAIVSRVLTEYFLAGPSVLIHGACGLNADKPGVGEMKGIDGIAHRVAMEFPDVQIIALPAHWTRDGRPGGPIRNSQLLKTALPYRTQGDAVTCLAFHDDDLFAVTKGGTADMVQKARAAGVPVFIHKSDGTVR